MQDCLSEPSNFLEIWHVMSQQISDLSGILFVTSPVFSEFNGNIRFN